MDLRREIFLKVHALKEGTGSGKGLSLKRGSRLQTLEARRKFDSTASAVQSEKDRSTSPFTT